MKTLMKRKEEGEASANKGEMQSALRRALNLFDQWVEVTGFVEPHTTYYYELQGVIEDAVHCGAQQATGEYKELDSEKGQ